jgi:hypothetical protein
MTGHLGRSVDVLLDDHVRESWVNMEPSIGRMLRRYHHVIDALARGSSEEEASAYADNMLAVEGVHES